MIASLPLVGVGAVVGIALAILLRINDLLADRGALTVLLAAIAAFYPIFAIDTGHGARIALHLAVFAVFAVLALLGLRRGLTILGVGLIGHALFDLAAGTFDAGTAPLWWPPFCAGVDIALGVAVLAARG